MITLTLVEALAVVMLTVAASRASVLRWRGLQAVLWQIGKSLLLLVPVALVGWKVVPRLLARETEDRQ